MGFSESVITIQAPQHKYRDEIILNALGFNDNTPLGEVSFNSGSERDHGIIDIGYFNGCVVILDHFYFLHNEDAEQYEHPNRLTEIESGLASIYPNTEILTAYCVGSVNGQYYSLVKNRERLRFKSIADQSEKVEYGAPLKEEERIYADVKMENGQPVYEEGQLVFTNEEYGFESIESQRMEDFVFSVMARHLGVHLDDSGSDELKEIKLRRYKIGRKLHQSNDSLVDTKKELVGYKEEQNKEAKEAFIQFRRLYAYYIFDKGMTFDEVQSKFLSQGILQQFIDSGKEMTETIQKNRAGKNESKAKEMLVYTFMGVAGVFAGLSISFFSGNIIGYLMAMLGAVVTWYFGSNYVAQKNAVVEPLEKDYSSSEQIFKRLLDGNSRLQRLFKGRDQVEIIEVIDEMPENVFWQLIEQARNSASDLIEQHKELSRILSQMEQVEIASFGNTWNKMCYATFTMEHYLSYCITVGEWVESFAELDAAYIMQGESFYNKLIAHPNFYQEMPDIVARLGFYHLSDPMYKLLGNTILGTGNVKMGNDYHTNDKEAVSDFNYTDDLEERIKMISKYYPNFISKYPNSNLLHQGLFD